MGAKQLLALRALCPPACGLVAYLAVGALGCARVVHRVGEYSATQQVGNGSSGTASFAGNGQAGGSGNGAHYPVPDAGASSLGQLPPDAALSVPSTSGKCTFQVQPAQRHPLDMYILMDGNVTLTLGLWQLATQGLHDFAHDSRSAGLCAGLRFYGTDCKPGPYDTQPTLPNDWLPSAIPAWDRAVATSLTLQASEMLPAVQGGIAHQTARVTSQAQAKHIVVVITDGFAQDLNLCPVYTASDVAAAAQKGFAQTPPIETHVIELDTLPSNTPLTNNPFATAFQGFDEIAASGGSQKCLHTDPTDVPGSVNEDLQTVRRKAQPCDFAPAEHVDKNLVGVALLPGAGSGEIPRLGGAANCGSSDGWYYDDANNPTRIVVCPATCTTLRRDDTHSIALLLGCTPKS